VSDVVLSPQTVALVGTLMTALVTALSVMCTALVYLYRQDIKVRDRLLDMSDARLLEAWKREEEKDIRIMTLEASNERLQRLAADATSGWKESVTAERARLP
jgi:hypothetical protein